jgi:hypothetical protein
MTDFVCKVEPRSACRRCTVAMIVVSLALGACGGGSKPPMVPDTPDPSFAVDAGADTPPPPPPPPAPKH